MSRNRVRTLEEALALEARFKHQQDRQLADIAAAKAAKKNTASTGRKTSSKTASAGEVRIIAGQWRRSKLTVAQRPGLRPTPDRVRETLFNWLGQQLGGWRCLDAFAGTGALGFEAASRGAAQVRLVEQDAGLCLQLERILAQLQAQAPCSGHVQVQRGDGIAALRHSAPAHWDLVLLDPPFEASPSLFSSALQAAAEVLADDGLIYLEAPKAWDDAQLSALGLRRKRYLKAGAVHAHLLQTLESE